MVDQVSGHSQASSSREDHVVRGHLSCSYRWGAGVEADSICSVPIFGSFGSSGLLFALKHGPASHVVPFIAAYPPVTFLVTISPAIPRWPETKERLIIKIIGDQLVGGKEKRPDERGKSPRSTIYKGKMHR